MICCLFKEFVLFCFYSLLFCLLSCSAAGLVFTPKLMRLGLETDRGSGIKHTPGIKLT